MGLPATAVPLDNTQTQQPQAQSGGLPPTAVPLNQEQTQPQSQDLSSIPNELTSSDNGYEAQPTQEQSGQSPLSFPDMMKMSALGDQESQQNFLKSKFKFAEPQMDANGKPTGQFMVGNDPSNLQPIHPGNLGDKAISALASAASMIPSIAGQMGGAVVGGTIGSLGGPAGTIAGGIAGAGFGAGLGEEAKNAMISQEAGYDPQKAAVDNIITAAFGAGGQALGEAIGIGAKRYIAPKIGAAIDGALNKNSGGTTALAKIFKFVANVDPKDTIAASKIGWGNLSKNHEAWNPDEIDNIAQDVAQQFIQKKGIATTALNQAEQSLLNKNPNAQVATADILEKMTDQFGDKGLKILNKSESSLDGMSSTFKFRDDIPSDVRLKDVKTFFSRLGAVSTDGGNTFHIPENANTSLSEAIGAKKLFQRTFNNPDFNQSVANVVKQGLYGEGPSPLYPKGFTGLRSAINDTAKATGHDAYVIANDNFSKLMDSSQGVLEGKGGNKFSVPGWMNMEDPSSIAKYLSRSNKLDAFGQQAIGNLHDQLGGDFVQRAKEWATAQGIAKASPQLLRLSIVGGLVSMALPGGDFLNKAERVPLAFALASPSGIKLMGRGAEAAASTFSANTGNQILNYLAKGASSNVGKAVLSQLVNKSRPKQ